VLAKRIIPELKCDGEPEHRALRHMGAFNRHVEDRDGTDT